MSCSKEETVAVPHRILNGFIAEERGAVMKVDGRIGGKH